MKKKETKTQVNTIKFVLRVTWVPHKAQGALSETVLDEVSQFWETWI